MKMLFQKNILAKWLWLVLAAFLSLPSQAKADTYSAEELDTLVSTIALYPDPLLAHVLSASTHRDEIPSASLWANSHKNLKGESLTAEMEEAGLDYDASVLALIPFPTVLATMAQYSAWTTQLGDAVTNQNGEVMNAVQRMRHAAYNHGNLKSDEYVKVNRDAYITIEPVKTQYVYVPVYNPAVVYYVHTDRYTPMHYSHGVWVGHWYSDRVWNDCWFEWNTHVIRYHPRPPRHPRPHYGSHPSYNKPVYKPAPRPDHRLPDRTSSNTSQTRPRVPAKAAPIENIPQNVPQQQATPSPQHSLSKRPHYEEPRDNYHDYSRDEDRYENRNYNSNRPSSNTGSNSGSNGGFRKSMRR